MKIYRILPTLSLILLLIAGVTSCSGSADKSTADSDSVPSDTLDTSDKMILTDIYLCADSIYSVNGGSVKIGTPVTKLPQSIEGLYDNIESDESESTIDIHFKLGEEYIFTALDFGQGNVDLIMANTARVRVAVPDGEVSLSSPFKEILSIPGMTPEWCDYDDSGLWYWTWHGLWFLPDQSHLTSTLSSKLYNEESMPVASDFDETIVIGYIGTGVPF